MPTPTTVVLFGATGDLAQRKLLPGLLHLFQSGLLTTCRSSARRWTSTPATPSSSSPARRSRSTAARGPTPRAGRSSPSGCAGRPVPAAPRRCGEPWPTPRPSSAARSRAAALPAACRPRPRSRWCTCSTRPDLVERSRIIMEKPFGTDLGSARRAQRRAARGLRTRSRSSGSTTSSARRRRRTSWPSASPTGSSSRSGTATTSTTSRSTCPRTLGLAQRGDFYESTGAYRDMVVTHLFQVLAFTAMEPPTALEPLRDQRGEEQGLPVDAADRAPPTSSAASTSATATIEGVAPDSETETFIALKCFVDNWRWAGVPFYLRTGKRMAEGARIISIAFREPPRSMFPPGSGVGDNGPDHLTFDLADQSKMSLSFYGKRPGPGMRLRQAVDAVRHARDRLGRCGARGLRAAHLRRGPRRPHPVHHGRGHRAALGALHAAARQPARRTPLCARAPGDPTRSTS